MEQFIPSLLLIFPFFTSRQDGAYCAGCRTTISFSRCNWQGMLGLAVTLHPILIHPAPCICKVVWWDVDISGILKSEAQFQERCFFKPLDLASYILAPCVRQRPLPLCWCLWPTWNLGVSGTAPIAPCHPARTPGPQPGLATSPSAWLSDNLFLRALRELLGPWSRSCCCTPGM